MVRPALPPVTRRHLPRRQRRELPLPRCSPRAAAPAPRPILLSLSPRPPRLGHLRPRVSQAARRRARLHARQRQINGMTWEQILAKAKGGTANWFLYGGSQTTNDYLDKYVIPQMQQQFGVTVSGRPSRIPSRR